MNALAILLERFAGTNRLAPIATGIHNYNVYNYDCHCGRDDCNDCYDCHCGRDDCQDCYDCHCGKDPSNDDCMGPSR